jgi:hypothetical protein
MAWDGMAGALKSLQEGSESGVGMVCRGRGQGGGEDGYGMMNRNGETGIGIEELAAHNFTVLNCTDSTVCRLIKHHNLS